MTATERGLLWIIILSSVGTGYLLGVLVIGWSFARYAPPPPVQHQATPVVLQQL